MTLAESAQKYPALIAYILDRNERFKTSSQWCGQLGIDEEEACSGGLADVARQMKQAQTNLGSYPYNRSMGEFLGLPLKGNEEPEHGYYMANRVKDFFTLGEAQRKARTLIEEGKCIRFTLAHCKKTGKPIRFATFRGPDQIKVNGQTVDLNNGKRSVRLSSNWSTETAIVQLVEHLETGEPYGGSR